MKKLLTGALALALSVSLAGCSKSRRPGVDADRFGRRDVLDRLERDHARATVERHADGHGHRHEHRRRDGGAGRPVHARGCDDVVARRHGGR